MLTEDYLMRIISQALAALMTAIGLRKAGKYSQARQSIRQAIEHLTMLPANLVDQMDDASILTMLTTQEVLDVGRLAILADLYQEDGEILLRQGQVDLGNAAFARSLRFILEVALSDSPGESPEVIGKAEKMIQRLKAGDLPVDTQLALSDYYQRLLEKDDAGLAAAGISRQQISRALAGLQELLGPSLHSPGGGSRGRPSFLQIPEYGNSASG
jgi:hypothetical protein